jgi:hypothetical protein
MLRPPKVTATPRTPALQSTSPFIPGVHSVCDHDEGVLKIKRRWVRGTGCQGMREAPEGREKRGVNASNPISTDRERWAGIHSDPARGYRWHKSQGVVKSAMPPANPCPGGLNSALGEREGMATRGDGGGKRLGIPLGGFEFSRTRLSRSLADLSRSLR